MKLICFPSFRDSCIVPLGFSAPTAISTGILSLFCSMYICLQHCYRRYGMIQMVYNKINNSIQRHKFFFFFIYKHLHALKNISYISITSWPGGIAHSSSRLDVIIAWHGIMNIFYGRGR